MRSAPAPAGTTPTTTLPGSAHHRPLDHTLEPPRPWPQRMPRGGKVYTVGADIAQARDASATVIVQHLVNLEREADPLEGTPPMYATTFQILGCERRPAGEAYPVQAKRLCHLCRRLVDRDSDAAIHLIMDQSGVGKPVLDLVREAIDHRVMTTGVTITGGSAEKGAQDALWRESVSLSKAFLVSRLQSVLQAGRIKMPRTPELDALRDELMTFEIRVRKDSPEPEMGGFSLHHDDLAIALSLAVCAEYAPVTYDASLSSLGSPIL